MKRSILASLVALLAAPTFAGDRNDGSAFYWSPYVQRTVQAPQKDRAAADTSREPSQHRDCAKCGCHKAGEEKASTEKR